MRRIGFILLAVLGLGGCVNMIAERQEELAPLIGQPEQVLLQRMGVPNRTYDSGGVRYLAYTESRVELMPSSPPYPYGPPFGGWYGGGFPPQAINLTCETTFAVAQGVVRSFSLRGNACG